MTQQQIDTLQITDPPVDGIGDSVLNVSTGHGVPAYTFSPTLVDILNNKISLSPTLAGLIDGSAFYMTSSAPALYTFSPSAINITTNKILLSGMLDGTSFYITSSNTMPSGLSVNTTYYAVNSTANDFQLSLTLAGSVHPLGSVGGGVLSLFTGMPGGINPYTKYYVVNATANSFQIASTLGGSPIDLTSQGASTLSIYTSISMAVSDPWDRVLTLIDMIALDPGTIVPALDNTVGATPLNPLVTSSTVSQVIEARFNFIEIGPAGSEAVFNGNDETPFNQAINFLNGPGRIYVQAGSYTFTSTVSVPSDVHIVGCPNASGLGSVVVSGGDFPAFSLAGTMASLDFLNIQAPFAIHYAALEVLGQRNLVSRSLINNFSFVGIQLGGKTNRVSECQIASGNVIGVIIQDTENTMEFCSFAGNLALGAVRIEGSACGVFASFFANSLTGFAYLILSPSVQDARLVSNHFASQGSLDKSQDFGSGSVRYGNTPNSFLLNQNNFIEPIATYVGQPSLGESGVTLGGSVFVVPVDNSVHYLPQETFTVQVVPGISTTTKLYVYTSQFQVGDTIYVFNPTSGTVKLFGADVGGVQVALLAANTNYLVTISNPANPNGIAPPVITGAPPPIQTALIGYPFASSATNLTAIDGEIDLLLEKNYEERNYFLESLDPTYDSLGVPLTGVFSWNGTSLTYPQFFIRSVLNRSGRWVINAGSNSIASGQVLYVTIDQTLTNSDIVLTPTLGTYPLPLVSTSDTQYFVLAINISGSLYWLNGFRVLTALSSFDVDGMPLPIVRYIGMSEAKNPPLPPSMFGGASNADLTSKLSAHSSLLKSLYERTNISLEPLTPDAHFSTDPTPGAWLSGVQLTTGIPATPTHLLELHTHMYGLDPSTGLYRYSFSSKTWTLIPGNPLVGPFTAIAPLSTGVGVLETSGNVAYYDPDLSLWTSYTPTLGAGATSLLPFATSRTGSFPVGGQVDYALQTALHSFFKTLSGDVVRYSLVNNHLELVPTIYTEDVGEHGLLSLSLKDTGYNVLRDPSTQFESLSNGISFTTGLPVSIKSALLAGDDSAYSEFRSTDFSNLVLENFDIDHFSGSWMAVYKDVALTKWYIFGGGRDTSYLYTVLPASDFPNFTAMYWVVDPLKQEAFALGATTSSQFSALHGSHGFPGWNWVLSVVNPAANSCSGCVGVMDYYEGGINLSDLWALVGSATETDMWRRDGVTGNWTKTVVSSTGSTTGSIANSNSTSSTLTMVQGSFDTQYAAFTFTTPDNSVNINYIDLDIQTSGTAQVSLNLAWIYSFDTMTFMVEFWTLPGIFPVTINSPGGPTTFTFATPISLAPNAQYAVFVQVTGSPITFNTNTNVSWSSDLFNNFHRIQYDSLAMPATGYFLDPNQVLSFASVNYTLIAGPSIVSTELYTGSTGIVLSDSSNFHGIVFTSPSSSSVASVDLRIYFDALSVGAANVYVKIWNIFDQVTNMALIGTSDPINPSTIPLNLNFNTITNFPFSTPVPISASGVYAITLHNVDTTSIAFSYSTLPGNPYSLITSSDGVNFSTDSLKFAIFFSINMTTAGASGTGFNYIYNPTGPLAAYGAASPLGIGFLAGDTVRNLRPTLFYYDRLNSTYGAIKLAEAGGDVTLSTALANSATQFYGASYHRATDSVYYVVRNNGSNTHLYASHIGANLLTSWSQLTLATSGLTLPSTITSANHLGLNNLDPIGSVPIVAYLSSNDGFSGLNISGSGGGFTSVSVATAPRPLSGFATGSVYLPQVGSFRGGEPSVSIGTWLPDNTSQLQYPVLGAGLGNDPRLGSGLFWSEPGTDVQNLSDGVWAGINRGGYFWVGISSIRTRQTELTPNPATVRGDITVASLGTMTAFTMDTAHGQMAVVFADGGNSNQLGFLLIDLTTLAVTYERAGFASLNILGVSACTSTPKISYNAATDSYDIVVQDDSRLGGQVAYYRRSATSSTWELELLGPVADPGATKLLATMVANAGLNPSKPLIQLNGDVVVASQVTATGDLLVFYRNRASSTWSTSGGPFGSSGFVSPELVQARFTYWVFGSTNGSVANVAKSNFYTSGFTIFTNPLATAYNRVLKAKVYAYYEHVAVASPLDVLGAIPASQEMGVFTFSNTGAVTAKFFAAKGRLQSHSGEEETSYGKHSWSYNGSLIYGATRPGRSAAHYSVRVSLNEWFNLGDSCLGSGRLNTIGDRSYREEYADDPSATLLYEFDLNHQVVRTWNALPIAERDVGNFTCLRYPYSADVGASALFVTGNPTSGFTADASLSSGTLPGVPAMPFPSIGGRTRIQGGAGASVLYNGSGATLSAAYLPALGVLKLNAQNSLTIYGSFALKASNNNARTYTITGPLVFNLDTSATGSHLVLQFPTASSLNLDTVANPLSYWTDLNYPQTSITIVLGEVREKAFTLYPISKMGNFVKLTYGTLEILDISEDLASVSYCAPVPEYCITKYDVMPVGIDSVTIKRVGALDGIQQMQFATPSHLLVASVPPNNTGYYYYVNGSASEGQTRVEHIAGKYLNLVDF